MNLNLARVLAPFSTPAPVLTNRERVMLNDLDARRRLQLLQFIVPGLLALLLISAPGSLHTPTLSTVWQLATGILTYSFAWWATLKKYATTASLALLVGVTLRSMLVILFDGPIDGHVTPATFAECFLLLLPVVLAGIFTEPRIVAATTIICLVFTAGIFITVPQSPEVRQLMVAPVNAVLIVLPLAIPVLIGFLMFIGTQGFRRMQQELADVRVALAREKEIEHLREQFISNVNHELRTPLMALQTYFAIAQELSHRGEAEREQQVMHKASLVVDDLITLVQSVLNIRRVRGDTSVERMPIPLHALVIQVLATLERWNAQQEERDIHVSIPETLLVSADQERLQEVITNLLTNALKYSPPGTAIEVSAQPLSIESMQTRPISSRAQPVAEIIVRDHGLGIAPEQAVLLFAPFVRLERDIASPVLGTGLGLAICRTHIEAMGGKIWIDSTGVPGEGTAFHFTLPLASS
jgi:signal transduction histidine kinase